MGRVIRVLTEREMFGPRPISGAMGGCPPPPPPLPEPPGPPGCPPPPPSPTAEPHVVATPAGAVVASAWVEGAELHYIASTGVEYAGTGISISTPSGAVVGSFWPDGENLFYIDASGVKRQVLKMTLGAKDGAAITGSVWVDSGATAGRQLQWSSGTTRYQHWNGV